MSDMVRTKLGLFAFAASMVLTSNAIGYEVGHWNWSGLLSCLGGMAAGIGIVSHRIQAAREG